MRQYHRYSTDLIDSIFLQLEVDKDAITLKAFHELFPDGLPDNTDNINLVTNQLECASLLPHQIEIPDEDTQDVIPGEMFQNILTHGKYFKFFGASQVVRGTYNEKTIIAIRTSTFDKGYTNNIGYSAENFNEWTDCSLWAFDFNFDGMNWYYPKNILFDSLLTKAHFARNELYNTYIAAPKLLSTGPEGSIFSSNETRKRLLSFFIHDKDDSFLDCSYYAKLNSLLGINYIREGILEPIETWKYSVPVLSKYSELPMPSIQVKAPTIISRDEVVRIKVSLYDAEFYLKAENGDILRSEEVDSNIVLEEKTTWILNHLPMYDIGEDGTIADNYIVKKDLDMYITVNCGYVNKRKISIKQGIGYFTFRALDLELDDEVVIKIGYKTFTAAGSCRMKVV